MRPEVGQRFGLLTVVRHHAGPFWICQCDCGTETLSVSNNLVSGNTKSCGCQKWSPAHRAKMSAAAKAKHARRRQTQ